jgi:hypothetical protein
MKAIEASIIAKQREAENSIASSRQRTRAKLDELSQMRNDIQVKRATTISARELAKEGVLQSLDLQTHREEVQSQVASENAAKMVDLSNARSQAMLTEAQARISGAEAMASDHAFQVCKANHVMENQVDTMLKDKMRESALKLETAHEYCQQVKQLVVNETAHFKQRMQQIELEADANIRTEERKVISLEAQRLSDFIQARETVSTTEALLGAKREKCEVELDQIQQQLRKTEAESRDRADQILAQWVAGSEAAEQAVRKLEQQGQKIMEAMRMEVGNKLKAFMTENALTQQASTSDVAELEHQANKVIDATQPALEAARRDDEKEAAVALAKLREAKLLPRGISEQADAEIQAKAAESQEVEVELARQAESRLAAAKAATQAAHEEERWLQAETAAAWSRIRKACFELRLVNLHDFAQGIVAGEYDAEMLEILGIVH